MNYFFYYKGVFIAYTDCKKMKESFLSEFKDKDNLKIEKIKRINREFEDDELLDLRKLYFDMYMGLTTNQFLTDELNIYASNLLEVMIAHIDRLHGNMKYIKFTDKEKEIIDEFITSYVWMLEDCESLYSDYLNLERIMDVYIYPSLTNNKV